MLDVTQTHLCLMPTPTPTILTITMKRMIFNTDAEKVLDVMNRIIEQADDEPGTLFAEAGSNECEFLPMA